MMLPRKTNTNRPQFISIEGNIGSGKSTVLKVIRQNFPELVILDQPLSDWQNVGENKNVNLLEIYYKDPRRWGFTFQIYAFMSRLKKWTEYSTYEGEGIRISQRSLLSDRYIFANIMKDMKILDEAEYEIYLECYQYMLKMKSIINISGIIYIRCTPEICEQRIKKRHREGEDSIPLDYLQRIHQKHEKWLGDQQSQQHEKSQILVIDNTEEINIEKINSAINGWLEKLRASSLCETASSNGSEEEIKGEVEILTN